MSELVTLTLRRPYLLESRVAVSSIRFLPACFSEQRVQNHFFGIMIASINSAPTRASAWSWRTDAGIDRETSHSAK